MGWHRCRSDRSLVRLLKRDFVRLTSYSSSVHISLLLLSFSHIVIIVALHDHLNMTFVLSGPTWFFEHATTTVIFYRSYTQPHSNSRSARHRLFWLYIHIFLQPQILDGYIAMMFVIVKERPLLKLIFDRFLSVFFFLTNRSQVASIFMLLPRLVSIVFCRAQECYLRPVKVFSIWLTSYMAHCEQLYTSSVRMLSIFGRLMTHTINTMTKIYIDYNEATSPKIVTTKWSLNDLFTEKSTRTPASHSPYVTCTWVCVNTWFDMWLIARRQRLHSNQQIRWLITLVNGYKSCKAL